MIRLNRTTEYGLMALRLMSRKQSSHPSRVTSAREVADSYGIPFEITAKTLQRLKEVGLIQSAHGAKGGYTLQKSLDEVSLAEFLEYMEGPQAVVSCAAVSGPDSVEQDSCEYGSRCEIKQLMSQLNARLVQFLSKISLSEFASEAIGVSSSIVDSPKLLPESTTRLPGFSESFLEGSSESTQQVFQKVFKEEK